jgi:hypothetical protein
MSATLLTLSGTGSHSVSIPVTGGRRSRATWSFTSEGDRAVKFRTRYEPDAVTVGTPPVPPSEWTEAAEGGGVTTALAEGARGQWIVEFKGAEWRVSAMMPTMLRTVPAVRVTFTTEHEVFRCEVVERSALIAVQLSALLSALASEAMRPAWDHALLRAAFDAAAAAIERLRNDESEVVAAAIDASCARGADDEADPASAPALLEDLDALAAWLTEGPMKDWSHAKIAKRATKEGFTRKAWWPAAAASASARPSASVPSSASKKKKGRKKRTASAASGVAAKSESVAASRGAQGHALYVRQLKAQRNGTLESASVGDFTIYAVSERGAAEHAVRVNRAMPPRAFTDAVSAAVGFAALAVVDTSGARVLSAKRLASDGEFLLCTVTFYANLAHSFDSLPLTSLTSRSRHRVVNESRRRSALRSHRRNPRRVGADEADEGRRRGRHDLRVRILRRQRRRFRGARRGRSRVCAARSIRRRRHEERAARRRACAGEGARPAAQPLRRGALRRVGRWERLRRRDPREGPAPYSRRGGR